MLDLLRLQVFVPGGGFVLVTAHQTSVQNHLIKTHFPHNVFTSST